MESILKSDIFFFVTTTVVVLLGIFAVIAIWYVIKVVRTVKKISETVKKTVDLAGKDASEVSHHLKEEAMNFALPGFLKRKPKQPKSKK